MAPHSRPNVTESAAGGLNVITPGLPSAMTKDECEHYVDDVGGEVLGMSQAYAPAMKPGHGCEVFSLFRRSALLPGEYLDRQFDNGREHQSTQSD